MEIRNFITFKKIIETGSFTKTSEELGYAQSTITAHIQAIEDYLSGQVFDRIGRQVILTDLGRQLEKQVDSLLNTYQKIESLSGYGQSPRGTIRIGTEESIALYKLAPLFQAYSDAYPEVEIILINASYRELEPKLYTGETDIIFVIDKQIEAENLNVYVMAEVDMVFVASPDYLEKRDSQSERISRIINTRKGGTFRHLFEDYLNSKGTKFENTLEAWSIELVKQSVIHGMGVTFVPKMTVQDEIKSGLLVADSVSLDKDEKILAQMAYHQNRYLSPALKAFIDMATDPEIYNIEEV